MLETTYKVLMRNLDEALAKQADHLRIGVNGALEFGYCWDMRRLVLAGDGDLVIELGKERFVGALALRQPPAVANMRGLGV